MRRNRVWQTDFSEFETSTRGNWRALWHRRLRGEGVPGLPGQRLTQTAADAVAALELAIEEAERLLGKPLVEDCVDPATGELECLTIVSDDGPAYKSDLFARFIARHPYLRHVRTRYRSPQSNGVIERFYGSIKYEHLFRLELASGVEGLNDESEKYRHIYNEVRPHESLAFLTPIELYLADPSQPLPEGWTT